MGRSLVFKGGNLTFAAGAKLHNVIEKADVQLVRECEYFFSAILWLSGRSIIQGFQYQRFVVIGSKS